ncbi:MAG: 4-hydroxy-3-methylbut-2-enyl diphosphate reductase [Lentimicrobium sp.]|nr:4-hydroxy-3-methylbut-2-enyl diphosphate reductase [Lentimicrobium sp.]
MDDVKPKVVVDPSAGFCTGVKRAIATTEKVLEGDGEVFCLGELVHNEAELERLNHLGMKILDKNHLSRTTIGSHVLVRAHGEPPETYKVLEDKSVKITDATCPVVLRLQQKVKKASEEMQASGGSVIIFGKASHAEVIGLLGNTKGKAYAINKKEQLDSIDFSKPIRVFSQTTSDQNEYEDICNQIRIKSSNLSNGNPDIEINNTICGQVSRRGPALEIFARSHDVVIFVSGSESSNGKYLAGLCKSANPLTYTVTGTGQINPEWVLNAKSVGVSGATSTPEWLMLKVAAEIEAMI